MTKTLPPLNLKKWIEDNKEHLKPPVSNKQLYTDSEDVILFVSGGRTHGMITT